MAIPLASPSVRTALLLLTFTAVLLSITPVVSAQEIEITGGMLDAKGNPASNPITLQGDRGFTFTGGTLNGVYYPGLCNGSPCLAGERVSLYAFWGGSDLMGIATLDGITYPRVGSQTDVSSTHAALGVQFQGSFLLPAGHSATTLVAPFVFNATFYRDGGPDLLSGSGLATIELKPILGYPEERWGVARVLYRLGSRLPSPWTTGDIGSGTVAGRASQVEAAVIVAGDGADIWGTADSFRFTYQELSGAGTVTARVVTQQKTYATTNLAVAALQSFAKSGVMMRESTAPDAASAVLDVKPNGELEFMARYARSEPTIYLGGTMTPGPPVWLNLTRGPGGDIVASYSLDGVSWTALGVVSLSVASGDMLAGLAVTSHDPAVLNGAVFDGVTVSGGFTTGNLLAEGDFEGYEPPALGAPGWISDDALRQVPAKSETNQPRSGARNGACWTTQPLDCGIYQEVVAPRSGTYAFSVYATSDRAGGLVGVNVNGVTANSANVEPRGFGDYSRYTMTFTADAGDVIRVWMYSPASPGYVVLDDATLTGAGN